MTGELKDVIMRARTLQGLVCEPESMGKGLGRFQKIAEDLTSALSTLYNMSEATTENDPALGRAEDLDAALALYVYVIRLWIDIKGQQISGLEVIDEVVPVANANLKRHLKQFISIANATEAEAS